MPKLEITDGALVAFNPNIARHFAFEQWRTIWSFEEEFWVKRRLLDARFDLSKPIVRCENPANGSIVFYQSIKATTDAK